MTFHLMSTKENCLGLIEPDGGGEKLLFFRILTTLLLPDEGKATVNGFDTVKDYIEIRNCIWLYAGKVFHCTRI